MANIQQLLNEEIRRLARKEVIAVEKEFKSQLVELRKTISELKNRIRLLEQNNKAQTDFTDTKTATPEPESSKPVRVTAARISSWRKKLGLNCSQYALLLEVSPLSVSHWESGQTTPRETQKRRIAELRDMSKRDLKKLCEAKGIKLTNSKKH